MNTNRFTEIYRQVYGDRTQYIAIWVDNVTGVNYLYHKDGNSAGLTTLVNKIGTPVVTPRKDING